MLIKSCHSHELELHGNRWDLLASAPRFLEVGHPRQRREKVKENLLSTVKGRESSRCIRYAMLCCAMLKRQDKGDVSARAQQGRLTMKCQLKARSNKNVFSCRLKTAAE